MKISLAGGGGAEDSRLLDEVFASWVGPQGRLLYWPIALRGIGLFQSCLEWITATFEPLGISDITMWTELSGYKASHLDAFDAVYIGGGNTFSLLAELRASGFDRHLKEYALGGKAIYGGSAGAAVLGRDISSVNHIDRNEVGLADTSGLDLVRGHTIWVHYTPQDDDLIDKYVRQYQHSVLAISERSGVVFDNGVLRSAGFELAYRFDRNGKTKIG